MDPSVIARLRAMREKKQNAGMREQPEQIPPEQIPPISKTMEVITDKEFGNSEPNLKMSNVSASSSGVPISRSNRGYTLLMKMGWIEGSGLGKVGNEGSVEPLHSKLIANDSQLGLGKITEYNSMLGETVSDSMEKRRRMCEGDESVTQLKVLQEEKKDEISREKSITHAKFYCDYCSKQYSSVAEWDVHCSSYAHSHTKNMKELRASEAARRNQMGGSKDDKRMKEARREERALSKRMKAEGIRLGKASGETLGAPQPEPTIPRDTSKPTEIPVKFSFGFNKK